MSQTATPTATPAAGTYFSTQTITLSDTDSGAVIYYTTDGSDPVIPGGSIYPASVSFPSSSRFSSSVMYPASCSYP